MIQSFFLISNTGEVLIEKHWRGVTPRTVCDFFWDEVNKYDQKMEMPPIVSTSQYYLVSIYREDIFLLATTTRETAPLTIIEFLHRVFEILEEYFGSVEEETIKDNFSTVYQLLEEMMDYGYPLTTEPNALKAMIKPPTVFSKLTNATIGGSAVSDLLPDGTISNMPWRKTGVKYTQNEIYLDIIEEIDTIIDRNGSIISSDVSGSIMANSRLSGVPDLALTFLDPTVIDDCSFHPCVRYNRYERDSTVSFVPPDGTFELMKYRINGALIKGPISAPVYCQPQLSFDSFISNSRQGHIQLIIGTKLQHSLCFPGSKLGSLGGGGSGSRSGGGVSNAALVVEEVVVVIPFTKIVKTTNLKVTVGTLLFDEATKVAKWTVGKLAPEKYPQLTGTIILHNNAMMTTSTNTGNITASGGSGAVNTAPLSISSGGAGSSNHSNNNNNYNNNNNFNNNSNNNNNNNSSSITESSVAPVIEMHWKVPMSSISGLAVSSLQMSNEKYKPYKGVRTMAKSGKFLIRTI